MRSDMAESARPKPVVLIVLDGWGVAPPGPGNALEMAATPVMDHLIKTYPAMTLQASSTEVGLSWGEMGNSEVGHLNIGAGRVYYQTLPRINKEIDEGAFPQNPVFVEMAEHLKKSGGKLHIVGLVSAGGVHSSLAHLHALLDFCAAQKLDRTFVHGILDGRDTVYNAGIDFVRQTLDKMKQVKVGRFASLSGRYYAMDRDNRWDRTEKAYRAMAEGKADATADDPVKAIEAAYAAKVYDEEFVPTVIMAKGQPTATLEDGDAVLFFNFRPDRARQIAQAFSLPSFAKFERRFPEHALFATMTEYEKDLPVKVAYPPDVIRNPLAKVVADAGLTQLHIAETEKYAHVTFFLNGTIEEPFPGEDRVIIPSPRVSSYDQKPEMSAAEIAARVVKEIGTDTYDVIALNFANADMVGHTGDLEATVKAAEAVDAAVGRIVEAALAKGGAVFITADHGNAEEVQNLQTGDIDKEHSTNPVPFLIVGQRWEGQTGGVAEAVSGDLSLVPPVGMLADVTPTILSVLGIPQPPDMTGRPLI